MTTKQRAGTTTFTGKPGPDFYCRTNDGFPDDESKVAWLSLFGGDCYSNAEDRDAWLADTMSGRFDWHWTPTQEAVENAPANAGSMCPVEYGGSHIDGQLPA